MPAPAHAKPVARFLLFERRVTRQEVQREIGLVDAVHITRLDPQASARA